MHKPGKNWWSLLGAALLAAGCVPALWTEGNGTEPAVTYSPPPTTPTSVVESTWTPEPFALDLTPLPSPTLVPTLALPAVPAPQGGPLIWDGLPTYPSESRAGFYFRLYFESANWALTKNQFGSPVLANRSLAGCVVTPASGRGLPPSGTVNHAVRQIGPITYRISMPEASGTPQFANYAGGDGVIFTAFQVSFADGRDECLGAAEVVLETLQSVPETDATPVTAP